MLSTKKLDNIIKSTGISVIEIAEKMVRAGMDKELAMKALKNWRRGLLRPIPRTADIEAIATALGVEAVKISEWSSSVRYAPTSPRKAGLVTQLIAGSADENAADVENLYVSQARVDGAGLRLGTKRWIAKDRGKAHRIRKMASHIHITVTEI